MKTLIALILIASTNLYASEIYHADGVYTDKPSNGAAVVRLKQTNISDPERSYIPTQARKSYDVEKTYRRGRTEFRLVYPRRGEHGRTYGKRNASACSCCETRPGRIVTTPRTPAKNSRSKANSR